MIAENEVGIKKFICSTVRPTQIAFSELYDMYECSSFLAGYILYEPLDPQTEPPKVLFSPTETLNKNTGDSFDLATLLCSFLLGAGYDAYVVYGYAPRFITLRDQSMTTCPMLSSITEPMNKLDLRENDAQSDFEDNTYKPPDNTVKSSVFIAEQTEKKRVAALDTFQLWISDSDLSASTISKANNSAEDLIEGRPRVHAWVMVLAGRRDVKEHVFLEPSTGRVYTPGNSPYTGVEAVWNNSNYWVNLDLSKKVSEVQHRNYELFQSNRSVYLNLDPNLCYPNFLIFCIFSWSLIWRT
jgi:hypothetical protein